MARVRASKPSALSQALGKAFAEATLEAAARAEMSGVKPSGLAAPKAAVRGVAEKAPASFAAQATKPRARRKV